MTPRTIADFETLTGADALTLAERALIDACRAGMGCRLGDTAPTQGTPDNTIRAELLKLLITGGTPDCRLHETGIGLEGGWIKGQLDLSFTRARGRTVLRKCHFAEKPLMEQAELQLLGLEGSHLPGIWAQGARVTGSMFLRSVTASGTVDVGRANIGGQLDCEGATFDGKGGKALNAQGVKVRAGLFLRSVTASGTVAVTGAEIGGQLDGTDATFDGKVGMALDAQGVKVGASLFLTSVTASGTVIVTGAEIGGQMACEGATFGGKGGKALNAQGFRVAQVFFWRRVKKVTGFVSLNGAHVGDLVDDMASWPDQLILDGFTYDRIAAGPTSAAERLPWLRSGSNLFGTFYPQPYTQLAKVLSAMGHERQARQIRIELEQILARQDRADRRLAPNGDIGVAFRSLWCDSLNAVFGFLDFGSRWIVGYGHRPLGAVAALVFLWLMAWSLADAVWTEGSFAPNSDVMLVAQDWRDLMDMDCIGPVLQQPPADKLPCVVNPADLWSSKGQPAMDWESFSGWGYGLDLVVPILTLGQTDAWAPSKDRGTWGKTLWWGRWIFEALGWIVTALGAAAITGIMQRGRD